MTTANARSGWRKLAVSRELFSLLLALVILCLVAAPLYGAERYGEPFRPQFHFTPERNWMNDPNGMVFHEGEYHLFYQYNPFGDKWGHMSWGHAVSPDLMHWEHLPVALMEENGLMIFSGSAVVDKNNTSGFGKDGQPPMVAIYTGHYTQKPLQNQHIAFSNDRGRTWTKFSGNPVLDIGEKDFRDPKVFWHDGTKRWIMVVAWPVPRKVRLYASPDLKEWTHLSDFGPAGSTKGIWECPDLFPLKADDTLTKWALIVNVGGGAPGGGSGCQYFVGEFDGQRFNLDATAQPKSTTEFIPAEKALADFEGNDYGAWHATGNAFGSAPARGTLDKQQVVGGFRGRGLVNSYWGGDGSHGTLESPPFEITHPHLSFLIGGGNHADKTCINLRVNDRVVRSATGDADERLTWKSWNVAEFHGQRATLEIVDRHAGGWGHINVDHIVLADAPARSATQTALWADFGPDFYAAVSWSDVPPTDGRRIWLGWMSNWEYANDVPTKPWRSAMTVARELSFRTTPDGMRLVQKPVRETASLRGRHAQLPWSSLANANSWLAGQIPTNVLWEIALEFRPNNKTNHVHFVLETGPEKGIRCQLGRSVLTVDRTQSGLTDFHPKFPRVSHAPMRVIDGVIRLRMLVDTSSVEFLGTDGESALTQLFFAIGDQRGLKFSKIDEFGADKVVAMEFWELKSAWR